MTRSTGKSSRRARPRIQTRYYQVGKGLTRGQALKAAADRDRAAGLGDFRGFDYNAKTGMAAVT